VWIESESLGHASLPHRDEGHGVDEAQSLLTSLEQQVEAGLMERLVHPHHFDERREVHAKTSDRFETEPPAHERVRFDQVDFKDARRASCEHGMAPRCLTVLLALAIPSATASCSGGGSPVGPVSAMWSFDFAAGPQGWQAGFAEYPAGQEAFFELAADYRPLPASLVSGRSALLISGNNHSDDLFMFYKRRLSGLKARTLYAARFEIEIATDVPHGCSGIGGSPGESVYLKGGATQAEPITGTDSGNSVILVNVDKGNQARGGRNALVLGTIGNSVPCDSPIRRWELKTLRSGTDVFVQTNDRGEVWLIVGTDSGFEGPTSIYYTRVAATFAP
jgi:hypothetical protein